MIPVLLLAGFSIVANALAVPVAGLEQQPLGDGIPSSTANRVGVSSQKLTGRFLHITGTVDRTKQYCKFPFGKP